MAKTFIYKVNDDFGNEMLSISLAGNDEFNVHCEKIAENTKIHNKITAGNFVRMDIQMLALVLYAVGPEEYTRFCDYYDDFYAEPKKDSKKSKKNNDLSEFI